MPAAGSPPGRPPGGSLSRKPAGLGCCYPQVLGQGSLQGASPPRTCGSRLLLPAGSRPGQPPGRLSPENLRFLRPATRRFSAYVVPRDPLPRISAGSTACRPRVLSPGGPQRPSLRKTCGSRLLLPAGSRPGQPPGRLSPENLRVLRPATRGFSAREAPRGRRSGKPAGLGCCFPRVLVQGSLQGTSPPRTCGSYGQQPAGSKPGRPPEAVAPENLRVSAAASRRFSSRAASRAPIPRISVSSTTCRPQVLSPGGLPGPPSSRTCGSYGQQPAGSRPGQPPGRLSPEYLRVQRLAARGF